MRKLTFKLLLVVLMVLPTMIAFSQSMPHEEPTPNVCLMKDYQAPATDDVNSIFSEDFSSGTFPPVGWTIVGDGQENWLEGATSNAGGTPPELHFYYYPAFVGNSRFVSPTIATSGYTNLLLSFKHLLDDYGSTPSYFIYVETTSDGGATWNEVWSIEDPGANVGPETLQLLISNGDVGSDDFQIAFRFDGDSYELDYWDIDDVVLSEAVEFDAAVSSIDMASIYSTGTSLEPAATVTNNGTATVTFDVTLEILDGATAIYSEVMTVTDLGAFESYSITYPTWVAVTGNFVVEVTADLTGDVNSDNDMLSMDIEAVEGLAIRKPLYEEFTSSTCGPCVSANEQIGLVLGANPDQYTLIKYQMSWPGSGDPYYTEEGGERRNYYGCSWVPDLYIVGEQLDPAGSLSQEIFDSYAGALTGLEIEITEASIDEDLMISVSANLTPLADYAAGLTAHIVVIEKLTVGNVGSNGETEWHNVMMKMLPDASGTTLDALTTGAQVTLSESYDMDLTFMETPNDLAVVVFVQDDTDKSVIQSTVLDVDGEFASYNVDITIEDEDGNPIEGATVMLEGNGSQTTDASGVVVYTGVFPGTYGFTAEAAGYFPGEGSIDVIDQDVSATLALVAPEFYWFEMFDVEPTDWTYHFSGWDYVYWYGGRMILFRQSGTTEPLMLVSPAIDIDPANKIMFDLGEQGNAPAIVDFGTMTDPADPATFTVLETYEALPEWQTFEYDLSNLSNIETDVYFAWSLPGADGCFFSVDNVILTEGGVNELCVPEYNTGCTYGDGFTDFALGEIENYGSGCEDNAGLGWSQYFELGPAELAAGGTYTVTMASGYEWNFATIWIDYNDDLAFTEDEQIVFNYALPETGVFADVEFTLPADAAEGMHVMRARTNYNGDCLDACEYYLYGEAEDYYVNIGGGSGNENCEDFDALTAGGYVGGQLGGLWTTWSGAPGTPEDALVSDMYSLSPSNSMLIEGGTDAFQLFAAEDITAGKWVYSNNIYIPTGKVGYWNLQKTTTAGDEWGFQIMYEDDMTMVIDANGFGAAIVPYVNDVWYHNVFIVDIDNDWAEFYVDDALIIEYQWSLGTQGVPGLFSIGGTNYFANPGTGGTPAGCHFDDICFEEWVEPEPCENFDALTVGGLVAEQLGGMWSTWSGTSADDATVTDAESNSPNNSFIVDAGTVDLIFMFDAAPISTGQRLYSHYMYVPSGLDGYFNVQTEPTPGVGWNIELTFAPDGTGVFAGGATGDFTYTQDAWFMVEINYDFASGYAQVLFDGVIVLEWENVETIGGIDYYGAGTNPGAYFDDVCFGQGWVIDPPVLPWPTNLTGPAQVAIGTDFDITWDAPGSGSGELMELSQHDNTPNNGYYQAYDNGYGVVFDLAAYPGATIEAIDFHHASWGVTGTWDYKIHIVDWDTYTELAELGPFQTTVNDDWEMDVDLGSYAGASGMVGIILEPMSNDPADAYPDLSFDVSLEGTSFYGPLASYSGMAAAGGDFLLDLWIMTAADKQMVQPKKVSVNNLTAAPAHNAYTPFAGTELTINQKESKGTDALTGYNVYRKFNTGSFQLQGYTTETFYTDNLTIPGATYTYRVTAVYDPEGESDPSNEWTIDALVGVEDHLLSSTILYPNPATDIVNITSEYTMESITVYNFAGQVVLTEAVNNTTYRVNTANFDAGIYLFQIETQEGRIAKRIIIE